MAANKATAAKEPALRSRERKNIERRCCSHPEHLQQYHRDHHRYAGQHRFLVQHWCAELPWLPQEHSLTLRRALLRSPPRPPSSMA